MDNLRGLYKNLFQFAPQPMWIYDIETLQFLDVNEAAIRHYGYSRNEFLTMTIMQIKAAKNLPLIEDVKELKPNEEGFIVNRSRHIKKDGELIDVELKSSAYQAGGKMNKLVIIYDITGLLKTEAAFKSTREELILGEKRFKVLVQGGSDVTSIINLDGIYQFVSESCLPLLGIKPEELIGKPALSYIHPDDQERVMNTLSAITEEKRITIEPYRFLDGNKQWRWLSTALTNLLDDPSISGIVTNSKDITDVIKANDELRLSNERYKLVLKAADEAICDWDIENDIVDWGIGFQEIFGYDLNLYSNTLWSDNIHPEDKERVLKEIEETLENPNIHIYYSEYRFLKANREAAIVQYRGIFLRDRCGKAIRAVGALRDITAEKKHLSRIQRQNAQLEEIAWKQSHNIRDSLVKIIGLVDLLKEEPFINNAQKELIEYISISAANLDQSVKEIVKKAEAPQ